jgi:hypothetical protein
MATKFCIHGYRGNPATCVDCNAGTFPGMETAVTEQAAAAGVYTAEELTKRMVEARPSIDKKTRAIEMDSPLFFGTIHPTLF